MCLPYWPFKSLCKWGENRYCCSLCLEPLKGDKHELGAVSDDIGKIAQVHNKLECVKHKDVLVVLSGPVPMGQLVTVPNSVSWGQWVHVYH